ncbi:MAG: hypothetical protein QOC93_3771 [Actinomycetota bacterium]|jgi:hypothetical protein|nr:hypothetical protein [Cryptosporangiaceae bacterium]MDQ1678627.1 hypothetical protein [Actinomycetota bacterium]
MGDPDEDTLPSIGDPTWDRLEDQLRWYDTRSVAAQRWYKRVKAVEIVVAAAVPVLAGISAPAAVTAGVAAVVVVLEGLQQLNQWQTNWVQYRSTAEALKHERYLYLAQAGPYGGDDRRRALAERLEGLVSQEHAKWTQAREATEKGESPHPAGG